MKGNSGLGFDLGLGFGLGLGFELGFRMSFISDNFISVIRVGIGNILSQKVCNLFLIHGLLVHGRRVLIQGGGRSSTSTLRALPRPHQREQTSNGSSKTW